VAGSVPGRRKTGVRRPTGMEVSLDRAPDILAAMAAGTARGRSVITF
jgi:hypothetical protein